MNLMSLGLISMFAIGPTLSQQNQSSNLRKQVLANNTQTTHSPELQRLYNAMDLKCKQEEINIVNALLETDLAYEIDPDTSAVIIECDTTWGCATTQAFCWAVDGHYSENNGEGTCDTSGTPPKKEEDD